MTSLNVHFLEMRLRRKLYGYGDANHIVGSIQLLTQCNKNVLLGEPEQVGMGA